MKVRLCSCWQFDARTTDTQWRHKSKKSDILGGWGRQNMLRPYLKIWDWDLIFGRAVKAISSPGVRSPCIHQFKVPSKKKASICWDFSIFCLYSYLQPEWSVWFLSIVACLNVLMIYDISHQIKVNTYVN